MLRQLLNDFLSLFFPNQCVHCGKLLEPGEEFLCQKCLSELPGTYITDFKDNIAAKVFWGRIPFVYGWSYLFFQKQSVTQSIMHSIKYKAKSDLALYMGELAGKYLLDKNFPTDFDAFVPVPLHPRKLKLRGYNQSAVIAQGIGYILKKPVYSKVVERSVFTQTQTKLSKEQRWNNVQGIFKVTKPAKIKGKHLVIVDDVLTTGATIESLANTLLKVPDVKLSFITLCTAQSI